MSEEIKNTGFGNDSSLTFKRIINADGSYNIDKLGASARWKDAYKFLIEVSWGRFLLLLLVFYLVLNVLFTIIYFFIGYDGISGIDSQSDTIFMQIFFFSAQTFTTVGYGVMSPTGFWTQIVSSIEAFTGFLSFSLMTGLLYGRFSKPGAKIMFSDNAIIAPYKNMTSLQIKLANERDNVLMDVTAKMILVFNSADQNGEIKKQYYRLPLEVSEVSLLPLSWTVVHPIDKDSPLFEKTTDDIKALHCELLVLVSGYDEVFSQVVNARTSYFHTEILWNHRFTKIFSPDNEGNLVLDLNRLNETKNLN